MLIILCVAMVVQLILFFFHQAEWFEPLGIFIAIIIANGVAAISENKQEGKASALKAEAEAKAKAAQEAAQKAIEAAKAAEEAAKAVAIEAEKAQKEAEKAQPSEPPQ